MEDSKIQVAEIKRRELGKGVGFVTHDINDVMQEIKNSWDEADIDSFFTIKIKEINREEYNSMPEFKGF